MIEPPKIRKSTKVLDLSRLRGGRFGTKHAKKFDPEINDLKDKQESLIEKHRREDAKSLLLIEDLEANNARQAAVIHSLE